MDFSFAPMAAADRQPILDILNHYVANSFAAYSEEEVTQEVFEALLGRGRYPSVTVRDRCGEIIGFGRLSPYRDTPAFRHTAVIGYFLSPAVTGRGVGRYLLNYLENKAAEQNISNLLAHVSSRNPISLKFHVQNGFRECGRFAGVGRKKGCFYDVVWMQKCLKAGSDYRVEAGDEPIYD